MGHTIRVHFDREYTPLKKPTNAVPQVKHQDLVVNFRGFLLKDAYTVLGKQEYLLEYTGDVRSIARFNEVRAPSINLGELSNMDIKVTEEGFDTTLYYFATNDGTPTQFGKPIPWTGHIKVTKEFGEGEERHEETEWMEITKNQITIDIVNPNAAD